MAPPSGVHSSFPPADEKQRLMMEQKDSQKVTIPDVVRLGHEKIKYDYHKLINAQSYDGKERWKNEFIRELALHLGAVEVVIFPWVFSQTSQGREVVDEQERQHEEIKQLVRRFQKMKPSDGQFMPTLEYIIRLVQAYIQSEEKAVLVPIERTLPLEESEKKARSFERKRHFLPTRIHPSRGYHWLFTDIEATFESPINRMGDLGRKFPEKRSRHLGGFDEIKREKQGAR